MKKKIIFLFLFFSLFSRIYSQEALKSGAEEYYDFLSLQGYAERPTLNYRTLSDSVWNIIEDAEHPWQNQNLASIHPLFGDFNIRIYGPELFMSVNTAAPYGQNDGVLWQGRGFNTLFKSGVRFEGYGVELTLLPHFAFSQNFRFNIMPSHYESEYGYFWGYGEAKTYSGGADAPQRFGDKPFFDWDFGDTEIRYTWKTLTIGFGTQTIWLGPAYLNPILHSNNAPIYPKLDVGLRRQKIIIPWLDWYIGDIETRFWLGRLSESDFFDNDDRNDYTMFHGFAFAYAPSFLPGLTLFFNRVCLTFWDLKNLKHIMPTKINAEDDQKLSFGISWLFSPIGFEIFGEIGIDDSIPNDLIGIFRHPFHSTVYTAGLKKHLKIIPKYSLTGEIIFEFNWMEMTKDFFFEGSYSYYFHHEIDHGYTNRGQWLGNGLGSGGNSQYLAFALYYLHGTSSIFIQRNNPDNDFLYKNAINSSASDGSLKSENKDHNRANFNFGINTLFFAPKNINISGGFVYNMIINPFYERTDDLSGTPPYVNHYKRNVLMHNFHFNLGLKLVL
ncbi:MAG: capsule assembly Wzi family protein [Treponema sp.]|nr:capsule assembly Wzi family protein [Treponema sp.]